MSGPASIPRSVSTQHMHSASSASIPSPAMPLSSSSTTGLKPVQHFDSAGAPHGVTPSASTPHLSHLRQSSSLALDHDPHHHHYPTDADSYDVFEEIGVGAFATVYHAQIRETREQVAIKVIDLDQFNTNWEEIRREILIMSLVHHPNVVRILTSFVVEQDLWLVMPLLEAGSCAHVMKCIAPTGLKDEALIATILREVLTGLAYFHKDGRLHRDLKAGNIIISAAGEVQLADFGVAGTLMENGDRKKARRTFTGTPCWMAPEVMEHNENGYDEKADVWSFGIVALELAYGRAPYAKYPPMKVMVLTLQEDPPTAELYRDHSYEFSKHFHSMIEKCLRKSPEKRPTVKKLLEHKFFKAARDKQYVIEKIVRRMPNRSGPPPNAKLLNLCALRHPTVHNGGGVELGGLDAEKGRPVSVGSWVFDKGEFDEMKMRVMEEREREGPAASRGQSVNQSYGGGDDTPRAAAAGGKFGANLAVPGAGGNTNARSPSDHTSPEDDGSEAGERGVPDFNDPTGSDQVSQDLQRITVSPPNGRGAASSAHSSPHSATPNMSQHSGGSPAGAVISPHSEHQEGRFHVRENDDDDDEGEDEGGEAQEHDGAGGEHYQDGANAQYSGHEQYAQGQSDNQYTHQSQSGDVPDFHNDAYDDEPQQGGEAGHTQHVGRFTCVDDDDDDEEGEGEEEQQ